MLRIKFPSHRNHFQSPVHARFLTFAHLRFSILNILTFLILIVGKSFFSETLSKFNRKTIVPLCVIQIPLKMIAVLCIMTYIDSSWISENIYSLDCLRSCQFPLIHSEQKPSEVFAKEVDSATYLKKCQ